MPAGFNFCANFVLALRVRCVFGVSVTFKICKLRFMNTVMAFDPDPRLQLIYFMLLHAKQWLRRASCTSSHEIDNGRPEANRYKNCVSIFRAMKSPSG